GVAVDEALNERALSNGSGVECYREGGAVMSKRGYGRVAMGLVAGVFMLALSVLPSQAQMRGGGGGFHGGGGGFHGGGFQGGGGFRGGHSGFHHRGFHHGGLHHGFRHP